MKGYLRSSVVLCIVLMVCQGWSLIEIINRGNRDFICNIVGSTLFWLAYTKCESVYKIKINFYIRLAVVISIISESFFGFYLNFYVISSFFDRIQHIFGTYALALFFYALIVNVRQETIEKKWIEFIFIVSIGIAIGSLYEILEFTADTIMKPQILNQPSLEDTDLDLISNTIGSIFAGIHYIYYLRK